jgi:hypothetical protein
METKINIAISQNNDDKYCLVISKVTETEDQPIIESIVKTDMTLDEVKLVINSL